MHISIDTAELSELDLRVLTALTGTAETPQAAKPASAKAKPARAAKPAPEPEPEPEEDDDILGDNGPTLKDAVARATELVGEKKSAVVKEALKSVGVGRVSELSGDQIQEFLDALADE